MLTLVTKVQGRPRIHATNAAKQASYRIRKRRHDAAEKREAYRPAWFRELDAPDHLYPLVALCRSRVERALAIEKRNPLVDPIFHRCIFHDQLRAHGASVVPPRIAGGS